MINQDNHVKIKSLRSIVLFSRGSHINVTACCSSSLLELTAICESLVNKTRSVAYPRSSFVSA